MPSNIFVTFGTLAGTEQLQTRTRTAYTYSCNCQTCTSCSTCYEQCLEEYNCRTECGPDVCTFNQISAYLSNFDETYYVNCTQGAQMVNCVCYDNNCEIYFCRNLVGSVSQSCQYVCDTRYVNCNPYECPPCYSYDCNCQTCCTWNNWSEWTNVETCDSVTPNCTNGALQRECRVV